MSVQASDIEGIGGRYRLAVWGGAAALMLLPLFAMRVMDGMIWDPGDFVFLGILLIGVGAAFELAARVSQRRAYLVAVGIALAASFLSIWINLAVGIIGSEDNPANLIYAGVIAVALVGAVVARLRPLGMAGAMVAAAIAQALAFVFALVAGLGFTGPITVFFVTLWLLSAWLFRRAAAHKERAAGSLPPPFVSL